MYDVDKKMEQAIYELEGGETLDSIEAQSKQQLNTVYGFCAEGGFLAAERMTCLMATLQCIEAGYLGRGLYYNPTTDHFALADPYSISQGMDGYIHLLTVEESRWIDRYSIGDPHTSYTLEEIADYVMDNLDGWLDSYSAVLREEV